MHLQFSLPRDQQREGTRRNVEDRNHTNKRSLVLFSVLKKAKSIVCIAITSWRFDVTIPLTGLNRYDLISVRVKFLEINLCGGTHSPISIRIIFGAKWFRCGTSSCSFASRARGPTRGSHGKNLIAFIAPDTSPLLASLNCGLPGDRRGVDCKSVDIIGRFSMIIENVDKLLRAGRVTK